MQILRHKVAQGQGYAGAGQAEDDDRDDVVGRAECRSEQRAQGRCRLTVGQLAAMRQVSQGPVPGRAGGGQLGRWDQDGRHQRRAEQVERHDRAGSKEQLAHVANAAARVGRRVAGIALDQRHDNHA